MFISIDSAHDVAIIVAELVTTAAIHPNAIACETPTLSPVAPASPDDLDKQHELGQFLKPKETPFYQLVEEFYPRFKAVYQERYQERYGFWRPAIDTAVEKFLECGDLQHGFARVRCPDCRQEFFVAFS